LLRPKTLKKANGKINLRGIAPDLWAIERVVIMARRWVKNGKITLSSEKPPVNHSIHNQITTKGYLISAELLITFDQHGLDRDKNISSSKPFLLFIFTDVSIFVCFKKY